MSEETLYCTNHPHRETVLRCGKCDRPFCTSCLVNTPVGQRCRVCADIRPSPLYVVKPERIFAATVAGLGAAIGLGFLLFAFAGAFALWISPFYGIAVGEAVSWAAKHKRGPTLQLVTIISIAVGAILGKYGLALLAVASQAGGGAATSAILGVVGRDIWLMGFAAIAVFVGLSRVR
ncbi:MAG: B-box zinc finger protein [Chloroflexota bacterium]